MSFPELLVIVGVQVHHCCMATIALRRAGKSRVLLERDYPDVGGDDQEAVVRVGRDMAKEKGEKPASCEVDVSGGRRRHTWGLSQ